MKTTLLIVALLAIAPLTLHSQLAIPNHSWEVLTNTPANTRTDPVPQPVLKSKDRYQLQPTEVELRDFRGNILQTYTLPSTASDLRLDFLPSGKYWLIIRRDAYSRRMLVRRS